jgi:DNA helicase II / ATP-dependent DNA helicase PcrA
MPAFTPRFHQQEVLRYRSGRMGVSAVPGSGKTTTLAFLAAQLIRDSGLEDDQEVLIVTLVNSAVDNFSQRVAGFVDKLGLMPLLNYRVRTLHGLAHDIVRERPALAGLDSDFRILDETDAGRICTDSAQAWLKGHPQVLNEFLDPDMEEGKREWVRREKLPNLVSAIAMHFIRSAKDSQVEPDDLRRRLDGLPLPLPLAEMCSQVYSDYQRALAYRGAVDFEDLIRLALHALEQDEDFLGDLRFRWPIILEDEAQDSSMLQEKILRLLSGPGGNWVRVGDPNQAIYETFTTANPRYLIDFLNEADVQPRELPVSGRSTHSIIRLANYLIEWTSREHPIEEVRQALTPPLILPTGQGDNQPNPPDNPSKVIFFHRRLSPQEEVKKVVDSLERWLPEHEDWTVAVLAPRNLRGFDIFNELERRKIPNHVNLSSTAATRQAAGALQSVLTYLADPTSPQKIAQLYASWRRAELSIEGENALYIRTNELLKKCRRVEEFTAPRLGYDWLSGLDLPDAPIPAEAVLEEMDCFRSCVQRWQGAALLPIDQAILTLAQDLFREPIDLAIAHKLALALRHTAEIHLDWRLPELAKELTAVANNQRRFIGFHEDDTGFDPDKHKGKVIVSTIHKAKGLEFDRVYLVSVNNYDFPSGEARDQYISEPFYIKDRLNLEAEALEQLEVLTSNDPYAWYEAGLATRKARLEYIAERLRLLFVGVTRARRELVLTWNSGRDGDVVQSLPYEALRRFWEAETVETIPTD